jgi:malate dehydrogenase (oxaloacetate-decarboxylating)
VGASGVACARIFLAMGVRDIIGCDSRGAVYRGRTENMNPVKEWFAEHTNPRNVKGGIGQAIRGADLFLGLSVPGAVTLRDIKRMARNPIVFAMANPIPEIMPEVAGPHVRVMATGRSDYPNQINNVLCFPGFFRGLLDCRARTVNDEMKIAAARAMAAIVTGRELSEEYILPTVFDKRVVEAVARAVAGAAYKTGAARRARKTRALGALS